MWFKKKKTAVKAPVKVSPEERLAQLVAQLDQSDLKHRAQAALKDVAARHNKLLARSDTLKEVKKFAEDNPEEAGAVLKNWMLEDKDRR